MSVTGKVADSICDFAKALVGVFEENEVHKLVQPPNIGREVGDVAQVLSRLHPIYSLFFGTSVVKSTTKEFPREYYATSR